MNSQSKNSNIHHSYSVAAFVMLAAVFVLGCSKKGTQTVTETGQKTFATPTDAGRALQTAVQAKDDKAISQILGLKHRLRSIPGTQRRMPSQRMPSRRSMTA
jgi:hypothetical protein